MHTLFLIHVTNSPQLCYHTVKCTACNALRAKLLSDVVHYVANCNLSFGSISHDTLPAIQSELQVGQVLLP